MEILNAKTQSRLGFWNVRTMFKTGKLAQVTSEMNRYNLHILGASESRWTGADRQRTGTGNMYFEGISITGFRLNVAWDRAANTPLPYSACTQRQSCARLRQTVNSPVLMQ